MADVAFDTGVESAAPARLVGLAPRISVMYAAIYLHYGAFGLYIPMWFAHRGLNPEQIGVLMSLPLLLRLLFVAPVTGLADRLRRIREVLLVCVIGAMLLMSTMTFAHSYWQMLLFFTLFSLVWDPLPILADGYATLAVRTQQLDYGRMRLWGSLSFVVASTASGSLIETYSAEIVPWLTAALLALPILPILLLPADRRLGASEKAQSREWRKVLADKKLMMAMAAAALITASHTLLTTFGAIQWSAQGVSGSMIGMLIGLAIVSEIA
ncbi:MAG: MFS transporter, partial [Hyphomonadaceae bacterium]|nr:MFS transporter [Hyphomonadaceae bacterium]